MLARTLILALFGLAFTNARAESLEHRLMGTWVSEDLGRLTLYVTFRPDHTCVSHQMDGTSAPKSSWWVRGDRLVEQWWDGAIQRRDVCRPVFRGERLWFGSHQGSHRLRDGTWSEPELWLTGVTFTRHLKPRKASNPYEEGQAGSEELR